MRDSRFAGFAVDLRDERASQRAPPHIAPGRRADAIGSTPARRRFYDDRACAYSQLAHIAALPGKPQVAIAVESAGIEVRIRRSGGRAKKLHLARRPADPRDRVLSAVVSYAAPSGPAITQCATNPGPRQSVLTCWFADRTSPSGRCAARKTRPRRPARVQGRECRSQTACRSATTGGEPERLFVVPKPSPARAAR